ncbi:MAG: glycosyltransferase family 4 protein [Alphaproteobacteria bacterium]|nr:glycosyltransferase family 4 protein [Alphaproteobacteria bacterium]
MRILMAARRYPPDVFSGTETVFQSLYQQARERHEVRLVVGFSRARELVPAEAAAVDLRGLSKGRAWARMARGIASEARSFRPDVVLSNSIEVPPVGVPAACIVHDLNFGEASGASIKSTLAGRAKAGFYAARSRGLDAVITVSAASARVLAHAGVPGDKVTVVHNGVDVDRFAPTAGPGWGDDPFRSDRGVGSAERPIRFAYPSRILPGKGQHHAIDAIARLPRDHKRRARLTVVGAAADPVYLDQVRVQAFDQPVDFATDVPDIAPYYRDADVILFPTVMDEGFGFTAVDAMAAGRPCIWFDQPAIREATGGIGVAVPRGDVVALRDAMKALMDDPDARARIGREGRAFVLAQRSWAAVWQRYEAVLAGIRR